MFDDMDAFVGETKVKNETDFFGLISALYLVNPLAKFTLTYNGYVYDLNVKWTAANGVKITFNIPPKQTTLKWFEK